MTIPAAYGHATAGTLVRVRTWPQTDTACVECRHLWSVPDEQSAERGRFPSMILHSVLELLLGKPTTLVDPVALVPDKSDVTSNVTAPLDLFAVGT